jgi:hypothetical protein
MPKTAPDGMATEPQTEPITLEVHDGVIGQSTETKED